MKIVFLSDTHGRHRQLQLPEGDLLVHAGDFCRRGTGEEARDFLQWFTGQPHPHKVFIAGNHDFFVEDHPEAFREMIPENLVYLENEEATVAGLRIWGSPITPFFHNFAFNVHRGEPIRRVWEQIPEEVDILLTHGPPHGILDRTLFLKRAGCEELLSVVLNRKPRLHLFGHIHEASGKKEAEGITFVNGAVVNIRNVLIHEPVELEYSG